MKRVNYLFYSTLFFCFSCQFNNDWHFLPKIRSNQYIDYTNRLEIQDSFFLKSKVTGFKNFVPASINGSKSKIIIVPALGSKNFIIYDLEAKSAQEINFKKYLDTVKIKEGIYNIGFYNDSSLLITIQNKIYLYNYFTDKIINYSDIEEKGYFSSYSKTAILINRKYLLSQWYSPKIINGSETDHFYEISPLSIYNIERRKFSTLKLPFKSVFKEKNVGQPIVYFDYLNNKGGFVTSPDTILYTFSIDTISGNFMLKKGIVFNTMFSKNLKGLKKDKKLKDIMRITTLNPQLTGLIKMENNWVLSYTRGLDEEEYSKMYEYKNLSTQGKAFAFLRTGFLIFFDSLFNSYGSIPLPLNIEGVSMYLGANRFLLKPKISYYYNHDSIPFYIYKLRRNENE